MTDVAAVSGQNAKMPGAVAGKGTAKGAGPEGALDAVFAALFGKAAESEGSAFARLAGSTGKAVKASADPTVADTPTTEVTLSVEIAPELAAPKITAETAQADPDTAPIDPATGKPRKATRGKADKGAPQDALLAEQAAIAAGAKADPATLPQDDGNKDADVARKTVSAAGVAQAIAVTNAAPEGSTGRQTARTSSEHAPGVATGQAGATAAQSQQAAAPNVQNEASGQDDQGKRGPRDRNANDDQGSRIAVASSDGAGSTSSLDPLKDIMQSLPPVVQSQLGVATPTVSAAAPVASTGELLGNHVIDMGVSGQWIDRMAKEIASLADGTGHSSFQLSPPNLGKLQVDLWHSDDKMNLRVLTETDEATRRLREGQDALQTHARVASLALGSVSVEKAPPSESARDSNQRQDGQQNANPNQQGFAQTQSQSGQGKNNSNGNLNRGGPGAVIGSNRQAESGQATRAPSASDPRVRFA